MTRRRRSKFEVQLSKVWRNVRKGARYVWKQTIVYNIVFLAIILFLGYLLINTAYREFFNCNYILRTSWGMPAFFCDGADFSPVVRIPGLSAVMDGPLEFIRRASMWTVLFVFVVLSGYITFIINNLKKVTRLITFNKQEWANLLSVMRIFVTVLFLFIVVFYLQVRF